MNRTEFEGCRGTGLASASPGTSALEAPVRPARRERRVSRRQRKRINPSLLEGKPRRV
jgi:hypothetical protein